MRNWPGCPCGCSAAHRVQQTDPEPTRSASNIGLNWAENRRQTLPRPYRRQAPVRLRAPVPDRRDGSRSLQFQVWRQFLKVAWNAFGSPVRKLRVRRGPRSEQASPTRRPTARSRGLSAFVQPSIHLPSPAAARRSPPFFGGNGGACSDDLDAPLPL